eukprot:IDg5011t1
MQMHCRSMCLCIAVYCAWTLLFWCGGALNVGKLIAFRTALVPPSVQVCFGAGLWLAVACNGRRRFFRTVAGIIFVAKFYEADRSATHMRARMRLHARANACRLSYLSLKSFWGGRASVRLMGRGWVALSFLGAVTRPPVWLPVELLVVRTF